VTVARDSVSKSEKEENEQSRSDPINDPEKLLPPHDFFPPLRFTAPVDFTQIRVRLLRIRQLPLRSRESHQLRLQRITVDADSACNNASHGPSDGCRQA
jgi:hypothetical protein